MAIAKKERDLTNGPLFIPIFTYVIPIILTGLLQVVYNIADTAVVGKFSGDPLALKAVGSTSSLFNLIINLLMGIAGGAAVVVAQSFGAKEYDKLSKAVHTSMFFSLVGGVSFCILGLAVAEPALLLMETPDYVMEKALLYFRIVCLGIPALGVYNFGAAILRSVGDSKTPLFILSSSGIINVLLNLFFVIVCKMSVEGVALATITSQYISAVVVVLLLIKRKNAPYALDLKEIKVDFSTLKRILVLGLPAGLQGTLFSISNVIITAGINTLVPKNPVVMDAKTVAISIEGLVYTAMNSYLHASTAFTGQNFGAKKIDRVKKSIIYSAIQVALVGFIGGQIITLFGEPLANLFINENAADKAAIIEEALKLMSFMLSCYFLCGIMDTLSGALRGLGYSMIPMVISVGAICVLRVLWIIFVFPMEQFNSLIGLYTVYPISWSFGLVALTISLVLVFKKVKKKLMEEGEVSSLSEINAK